MTCFKVLWMSGLPSLHMLRRPLSDAKTAAWISKGLKRSGVWGCQECYKYFSKELDPILRRIQGNIQHRGKVPAGAGTGLHRQQQIARLKEELQRAVELEAYERAAELRDKNKGIGTGKF